MFQGGKDQVLAQYHKNKVEKAETIDLCFIHYNNGVA